MSDTGSSTKGARLEDIARQAGVSISTVSRALNDSPAVNRRTKQLVWKIAREYDYAFRRHMPAGPIGADATIAVVIPELQGRSTRIADPFFFELLSGINAAARERRADLLVSHLSPRHPDDLEYALTTSRANGVIFIGQSALHHAFNSLADHESRFLVWGAQLPDTAYCSIGSDNEMGGQRAASHLLRLGRKCLLFLGDTEVPEVEQRLRGYKSAHRDAGLEIDESLFAPAHFDVQSAEATTTSILERGTEFDGVIAATDLIAIGAIKALLRAGRKVPEDVSVVGYDNIQASKLVTPELSTIDQDTMLAGRMLVAKLLDTQGDRPSSERIQSSLIVRESCGA